eukprot:sb/3471634/
MYLHQHLLAGYFLTVWAPPISECKFKIIISSCVHFYIAQQEEHTPNREDLVRRVLQTNSRIPELTIVKLTIGVVAILIFILFLLYCLPKYVRLYNQMRCFNNPVVNVLPCKKRVKRKKSNVSFFKLINSNRVSNQEESGTRGNGYHVLSFVAAHFRSHWLTNNTPAKVFCRLTPTGKDIG